MPTESAHRCYRSAMVRVMGFLLTALFVGTIAVVPLARAEPDPL